MEEVEVKVENGNFNMEYNSNKVELIMPEYGRNVQKLVQYAKTIEDKEHRQKFVERVVDLMHQMNPQNKNVIEYREKLWKHVFHIGDYELDVIPPNGEIPEKAKDWSPEAMEYPEENRRFRHYGYNVQTMIKKAMAMEEGPKKDGFVEVIGSFMKLAYRNWNRDHYVSDENIKNDLEKLSDGQLTLKEGSSFDGLKGSVRRNTKPSRSRKGGRNDNKNKGRYKRQRRR